MRHMPIVAIPCRRFDGELADIATKKEGNSIFANVTGWIDNNSNCNAIRDMPETERRPALGNITNPVDA